MKKNSKVSVAIHSLVHLAVFKRPLTSEELGECQHTNPVVIRRILGQLKEAGLVTSEKGHGGGWSLTKKPQKISFQDVFAALNESLLPSPIKLDQNESCLIMKSMSGAMDEFLSEADALLSKKLNKILLSDIMKEIEDSHLYFSK